jgi:protein SCO1/2
MQSGNRPGVENIFLKRAGWAPMRDVFCSRLILFCLLTAVVSGCRSPKKSCCGQMPPVVPARIGAGTVLDLNANWQDDAGKNFQLAELRGQRVVISMFSARCEGVCVITKNDLKAIEASLPSAARENTAFVLVTLAPERDSTAVLKQYRAEQGLGIRWRLLRGSPKETAELAACLGIGYGRDRTGLFRHGSEITALDDAGNVLLRQDGLNLDLTKMVQALTAAAEGN